MSTFPGGEVFDACTMVGPWHRARLRYATVEGLAAELGAHAIGRAWVFHSVAWLHDFRRGNETLDRDLEGWPNLLPCYAVIPFTTGEMPGPDAWDERLDRQPPFAWRIFPRSHNFMLNGAGGLELFAYAASRRLPVFVDIDEIDYRDLWRLCQEHPALRLVVGNAGTSSLFGIYREFRKLYEFLETFPHVMLETSFLIGFRGIEDICERFGAERLLFGSRMPFLEPGSALARLLYAKITDADRHKIAAGNVDRLLREVTR